MTVLLIKLAAALFFVSIVGALIGIVMAKLLAPTQTATEDEQGDQRSQRGRY